nr:hypothetical protein [Tanacetum cinerariifolium]
SPYATSYHTSQFVSQGPSSSNLSISYPVNDVSSIVNHNAYMASSSAPQIDYAPMVHHSKRDAKWFKDKVLLVQAQANGQVLQEEELEFLADLETAESSSNQNVITERVLKEQKNDDKASTSYEPSLEIETLKHTLSEHLKEKESLEQKITLLKNDFQKEESRNIDRELALEKQELPKVSMVNACLKKLKFHLASFDMVVKERITATAITEGTWGFKHTKACFRDDIIPFVKDLQELFTSFD